jgi:hypothetical protein
VRAVHVDGRRRSHARRAVLHVGRQRPFLGGRNFCKPFSSVVRMHSP